VWSFVTKEERNKLYSLEHYRLVEKFYVENVELVKENGTWTVDGQQIPEKVAKLAIDCGHAYTNIRYYNVDGTTYKLYDTDLCLKNDDSNPIPKKLTDKVIAKYRVKYLVKRVYDTDEGVTLYQHHLSTSINGVVVDKIDEKEYDRCLQEADLTCYYTYDEYYFISDTGDLYNENGEYLGDAEGYKEYIPDLWRHPEYDRDIPDENL